MSKTIRKHLSSINQLREKGEYKDALKQMRSIAIEKLSPKDKFSYKLLECRLQLDLGKLNQAHSIIDELEESQLVTANPLFKVDILIFQAEIYWRSENMDKALESIETGFKLLDGIDKELEMEIARRRGDLFHNGGIVYWYQGDLDIAIDYHKNSLKFKEALKDKEGIGRSLNNLGLVYWSKGDNDQAIKFFQKALEANKKIGNRRRTATIFSNLGNCYVRTGDLGKALEYQQQSLTIRQEYGLKRDIFLSLINLGSVFQLKGDLTEAQNYYQQSLEIAKKTGIQRNVALAINNLGNIYELKGYLDQALECFQKSLAIYEKLGIKEYTGLLLSNVGGVYRKKGDYRQAQKYYQLSLEIFDKLGNEYLKAVVLLELVWIALERRDSPLVDKSLQQLKTINVRANNRIINQRFRIAQALVLKTGKRTRQKLKAAEILEEVVAEDVVDHSLTVTAMIHLCDLLLSELKLTGEAELIGDISELTNRLLLIAKQQSSHSLLVETYLLQSKLALVEMDMGKANKLLTQAQAIADETGLEKLAKTLLEERNILDMQMQKWASIIKENPTKQEMIALTKLDDLLERMIQETVTDLMDEKGIIRPESEKKYKLVYLDLLRENHQHEQSNFRIGIAQIGLSQTGDILSEFYQEDLPGLFRLRENKIPEIQTTLQKMVKTASTYDIKILAFPELTIDLNSKALLDSVLALAMTYNMYIIPGSYHNLDTRQNISTIISPKGILWQQTKRIPATIHFQKQRIIEGIVADTSPTQITVANTEYGRIAIIICRDFLDMDLRVELKNHEPPIDVIINPAFTPVTADFKATHFDARRSIYAYSFFVNVAEFGDSLIYTPEKERAERTVPPGKQDIIYKDINLFELRSARKEWERKQNKTRSFIQSTR